MNNDGFPNTDIGFISPHAGSGPANESPPLNLYVRGFKTMEKQLLAGTVRLSQRRKPRLEQLEDDHASSADVVMVDAQDPQAMRWAQSNSWLQRKVVIWVDATSVPVGHTGIKRPVQWPILPMLLARALEHAPSQAPAAQPGEQAQSAAPSDPGSMRLATTGGRTPVLVVDDSLTVRAHLRALLEPRGFAVTEAESAEEAIRAAATARFACILMDVLMPGIDGYEACRRIKSNARAGARPAVLMLTSKSSPFDRIRGRMAGCDAYLTKPVNPDDLHEVLLNHAPAPSSTAPVRTNSYVTTKSTVVTPPIGLPGALAGSQR